jgi:hypothetical protein
MAQLALLFYVVPVFAATQKEQGGAASMLFVKSKSFPKVLYTQQCG